ncbi:hypothetical protein ONZ43_g1977 [Nemania bipapillata]|uniref:Uncharacterized protein n=1 Tax=Nemania bipapillata TaxID=110536 RepID=A0ACC2J2Q8_9PEZI|nr:hypothetical protein ONZ43_g1977 [Nemania bipapillata]
MESAQSSDSCIICNKPNALRCNRCKSASYCSKLCQRGDFLVHKLLCSSFSAFDVSKRPTKQHVEPEDEYDRRYQSPNARPFLNDHGREVPIQFNAVLARRLLDAVCVSYRDTFLVDGSAPNSSVATITTTQPGYHHHWCGPIIAYGKVGSDFDPEECRDIDMHDFRHVADYFMSYGTDLISVPSSPPMNCVKVKGVRINCLGDQKMFNKPHFEEIELSTTSIIFRSHETSDITKRIGIPIYTKRCFPHPNWANAKDAEMFGNESPYNNQDATFLHLCIDPEAKEDFSRGFLGWSWAPSQWQQDVGSTIVVRQDKKPLLPWHAEALCSYCRYHARDCLAHTIGEYAPDKPMSKSLALSMICRPTFSIWWYRMCREQRDKGKIVDAKIPYDE